MGETRALTDEMSSEILRWNLSDIFFPFFG